MKNRLLKKVAYIMCVLGCIYSIGMMKSYAMEDTFKEYDNPKYETEELVEGIDYDFGSGFNVYMDTSELEITNESDNSQPRHTQKWVIKNKVNQGSWVDFNSRLGKVLSGDPGTELNKSFTKSWKATTNLSFGIDKKAVSSALGFSITSSYEVTDSVKLNVPSYHDGKKIDRVELIAYKLWEKHTYDVYLDSTHFEKPVLYGNYYANKPYGIHFEVVYYYE
jgi:hypothetical protein